LFTLLGGYDACYLIRISYNCVSIIIVFLNILFVSLHAICEHAMLWVLLFTKLLVVLTLTFVSFSCCKLFRSTTSFLLKCSCGIWMSRADLHPCHFIVWWCSTIASSIWLQYLMWLLLVSTVSLLFMVGCCSAAAPNVAIETWVG
jgi:hypothetical protein